MTTLVESFFFADPPQPQDAPGMGQPLGRSRAMDVFIVSNPHARPRISYDAAGRFTTVQELEEAINRPLLKLSVHDFTTTHSLQIC